jgi:SAM-dependent methyltransferase
MDSDAWDARYAATELLWSAEPNRFLVAQVSDLAPGRALDIACGEGRNAIWLAEHGWEVTGVDFSPVALDKARRLADGRGVTVRWLLADAVTDALEPAAFDLVAVFYLQLPSEQRRAAFAAAARAVAPGGTLLVVGHDTTNLTNGWGGPRDATVLYSPDDVAADIDYLEVVKAERVERPVLTEEGPKIAIDVLVRAIRPA